MAAAAPGGARSRRCGAGFGRVAVWLGPGAGPGNEALTRKGAVGVDDLDDVFAAPLRQQTPSATQGMLDFDGGS